MTTETLHFELPKALVLNANDRTHWAPRAAVIRNLRAMGIRAAQDCVAIIGKTHLTVRIGYADNRRRDDHNLMPTYKALIDGIVEGGLIEDDNRRLLTGPDLRSYVAAKTGILVLDFEFESAENASNCGKIGTRTQDTKRPDRECANTSTGPNHNDLTEPGAS